MQSTSGEDWKDKHTKKTTGEYLFKTDDSKEVLKKKADFIFTHHPFIFKPLKTINTNSDPKGKIIEQLIKNDITLFSAHTNLDFTKDGVSFELAKTELKIR